MVVSVAVKVVMSEPDVITPFVLNDGASLSVWVNVPLSLPLTENVVV